MISPKHTYFGGKTVYFDNVDPDLLSTIELKYMMEEVGYTNEPEHGLHPLVSDNDITDMVKLIPRSREMTIYVEHDVDTPYIATEPPQDQTSNYSNVFDEILDDVFSQVPVELFSQATYSQPDEVNNEERVGVNDIVIASEEGHGPYETFVQESGQCTNGFHYEHGTDNDDSDYELYDSENDAAIEDDNLLFDKYVDLPLLGTITRDRVDETILPENVATENLPTEKELPTEELHSPVNSDDEEQSSERDPEFNASTDMENPSLKIRMSLEMPHKVYMLTRDRHILDQKLAARKKRQSSGSSAQMSGTSTTVGNEDQVMNQHTTVVQVDVGDVVHSSDGGPAPKKSKLIARRNNPKQALYCDPHEATKVQDNSQLTITRGVRGATFTTIPRVEMLQGRVGSSNPMTGVSPHPPTITEGAKGATFTTIPRVEMPQSRFGSSSPKTGWPPHPPTTSKQTVAPWKPPGKSFVHKNKNLW
ncbi:unnamed protein product [Malus baccata var. baccata]